MPNETATAPEVKKPKPKLRNAKDEFQLEPPVEPGKVPDSVINELRTLRTRANDATTDFREAVKTQAEKHHLKPSSLRRYVVALGRDRVDDVLAEAREIESLVETAG